MDLYCPVCGEPWDHAMLHDVYRGSWKVSYATAAKQFRKIGCELFDTRHSQPGNSERAWKARTIYGALGDDMDGAASVLDEWID